MKFVPLDEIGEDGPALTFVPLEPESDSFFSLDRAKETALGVARLIPGLEDLGRDAPAGDRAPVAKSRFAEEARGNLPAIDKDLQLSAPKPAPKRISSVLDGAQMTGGAFDAREADRLSRRDYAEQAEREALYVQRGSPSLKEQRAPILNDRQKFAEANPVTAGFAQSAANTLVGTLNAPSVVAGLANETLVRPVARAVVGALGGDDDLLPRRVPNMPLVDDLRGVGAEYASQLSRKSPGQAWDDGDFGRWMLTQMSGNSFSAAQSLGALFVPGAQATLLASMGAVSAGNAYAGGDSAKAAALKGLVEAGSELLPLKAAEKIKDMVLALPAPVRQQALAEFGKRALAAGTAITTNSLVGGLEEVVAQVGGNAVDKVVSGQDKNLFDEVDRAAIVGAAFGGGMAAPAVAQTLTRNSDPAAQALADALNQGRFDPAGATASVDNALRTQAGNSAGITPTATSMAAAAGERARMEAMRAKPTVADIGNAASVDEAIAVATQAAAAPVAPVAAAPAVDAAIGQAIGAIATGNPAAPTMPAATRPVQLDEATLLQQAMVGIDQSPEATAAMPAAQPIRAMAAEAPTASAAPAAPQDQPIKTWFGRRGDGYATPEDAGRALGERKRLQPALNWNVEQMPDGRYRLAGYGAQTAQSGPAVGVSGSGNTQGAVAVQNAAGVRDTRAGGNDVPIQRQPPAGGVWAKRADGGVDVEAAAAVEDLAVASGQAGRIQLISRDAALRELDAGAKARAANGLSQTAGAADANEVLTGIEDAAEAAEMAFGWRPTLVTGLPDAYGVQYKGRTYLDIGVLARGDKAGNPVQALVIQTIGHETTHALEKSADPQDQADYQRLRQAVLANAKPDRLAARIRSEGMGQTYGENEVVADVSGDFWLDPAFWARLHDIDSGSTMRRIAYKFMENAAKLVKAVKGSRLDAGRFINNVEQVREVAAQVWASKAKRGGSLFGDKDQTVSKSRAAQSNFEVAPDPNDANLSARWNGLPLARKLQISREVAGAIVPEVLALRGAKGAIVDQFGSYLDDTNPSFALRLTAGSLQQVSMDLGYVLSQDSMMNLSADPFEGGEKVGAVSIELGEKTFDEISDIYATLRAAIPEIGGQSYVGGEMVVLNYSDIPTSKLTSMVDEALGGQYNVSEDVLYSSFPTKEEYDDASGSNDAGAQGQAEGGVRRRLGGLRAEATRRINDSLSYSKAGAGVPYQQGDGAPQAADLRGAEAAVPGTDGRADRRIGSLTLREVSAGSAINMVELRPGAEAASVFLESLNQAKSANTAGASVAAYSTEEYSGMRLFLEKGGMYGIAIKPDGDIVSVFRHPESRIKGVASEMVRLAVMEGGWKLDAFDTVLPAIYSNAGMRAVARIQWNDEYAPDGWNYSQYSAFNGGRPDVVFMAYDPARAKSGDRYTPGEGRYVSEYDDAVAAQEAARNQQEATNGPSTSKADAETDRSASAGNSRDRQGAGREADARESVPAQGGRAGGVAQGDDAPRYGQAQEGAVSRIGYHFSKNPRASLSGAFYGDGMPGRESGRLSGPDADDIRPRIFFYVDKGNGVMPESGVGAYPHHVQLDNLYDVVADPLGLVAATRGMDDRVNAWERAVLQAGFDGYLRRDPVDRQDFAVLLGARHDAVPVSATNPKRMDGQTNAAPAPASAAPKGRISSRVGNELRRRPAQDEVMEIIGAVRDGLPMVAPSFKMEAGEARVLVSEAEIADKVFAARGAKFHFGRPSWSRADIEDSANFKRWFDDAEGIKRKVEQQREINKQREEALPPTHRMIEIGRRSLAKLEAEYKEAVEQKSGLHRWFGKSKAAGANGSPLVLYHGTSNDFSEFRRKPNGRALWAADQATANSYAGELAGSNVMPVFMSMQNPLEVDAEGSTWQDLQFEGVRLGADSLAEIAEDRGFDGLIIRNLRDFDTDDGGDSPADHFAVFKPTQIKSAIGNNGNFDPEDPRITYSFADMGDIDELGAFDLDAADIESYGDSDLLIDPTSADFKAKLQAELQAEMAASAVPDPVDDQAPNAEAIDDAGLWAEDAFDFSGNYFEREGREPQFIVPAYIVGMDGASIRGGGEGGFGVTVNGGRSERGAYSSFIKTSRAHPLTLEQIKAYVSRQAAGYHLHEMGHDIASAYRKNKLMQIANSWRQIAKVSGAFKLPEVSGSTDFVQVAKDMGAFKGYEVSANVGADGSGQLNFKDAQGVNRYATVTVWGKDLQCCTMGLVGGGGLGTEFYAVQAVVAKNMGKRFVADDFLSGINSYRRTEQAFSYALKSGDTGVILPGGSNRVYGYNENPKTQEDHDKNIARLALAGMRNVQELMPGMRRYSYDAATDAFLDARGRNADAAINELLAKPEARAFGLGRATVARAVLTSQIIKGDLDVKTIQSIAKPVAYSMADAELDQPLGEGWGEPDAGVEGLNPNLRRFMAGSKIVNEDGTPIVMYHGTARDIESFRAKQAGAIFLSYSPKFAGDFAALSGEWMQRHWQEVLTPEQINAAKAKAAAVVMADKSIKMTERRAMKQAIMDGQPEGAAQDAMMEAVQDAMPSGENILPVVVRATAPFDFRDRAAVEDVVGFLFDKNMAGENDKVRIRLVSEKGDRANMNARVMRELISGGAWDVIESPDVQEVIRELGHDGFFVKEDGQVNLAVYQPSQIKSVFNHGSYSLEDERLSYSRAALDDYMVRRNKAMPTISGAAAQEADIALAVKAINAASVEIEGGNKTSIPIPIGRTPHVIGLVGGTNKMMRIDASILRKVLFDKHAEDFAGVDVERFVRAIYQPAMVLSGREKGGYEVVTDIITKSGPIIVPLIDGGNSTAIMSAYAKKVVGAGDSLVNRIKGGKLLYADPVLAQSALTGRDSAPVRGINAREQQFSSAPPRLAQPDGISAEFSAPSAGINALGAQFLRSPPAASRTSSVNQQGLQVKPLNPNFVGWDQVRGYIIDGISQRKVKSDVDLMRRIGDLYRGDWADAPSFSRASGGFDLPEETLPQNARRKAQDFFLRAQVVQEAIAGQGGRVDEKTDFYRAEELSHGRMGSLLQDFATNQVQPLMEKLVSMGVELDELSLYAYAKHAPERNREIAKINKALPDGGSGMTDAEAAGILQMVDLSGDRAKFEELHADLMAISSTNRLAMLADGLITQDEFNALDSKYENYIPLRGFEQVDESDKPVGRPAGRGFNIRGKETMRALGRRTRAGQLIENVIGDYQRTVVRGERNYVAKVFLNFVLSNPDPDLWEIDAQRTRLALDRQTGKVVKNTLIDKGEDTISVKVAGQEIYIKIKDPLLLRAMRKQHASDMGEQHRVLVSALGLYTTMLRNTLTRYNPEFALVNAVRDVGFGALAAFDEMGAGGLARFAGNYAGATAASFRAERNTADPQGNRWDRTLAEYKAAGGATSGFYAKDLEGISSDIRGMMIDAGAAPKDWTERARHNAAVKMVARFGRVLEFAGSVSENAARVAAYKTARDMGQGPSQAASIAKNLTTNFDRKGEWGATLNAAYVFFNAAVQGSHRTLKMFANPKVAGVLMGTAVSGVALALHAAAAGGDDPDDGIAYWDKIPAYVKERNLIIMLPPGAVMDGAEQVGTNGRYISIPVQYGLNIFPLLGYQIADVLRNQKDQTRGVPVQKAAIAMASAIAGSFNPLGGAVDLTNGSSVMQALAPSIFDPVIQGTTGTNGFGREVAPFKSPFDTKPDSQNSNVRQAGGPAEAVAQWLNRVTGGSEYEPGAIDLSPGTVENTVRNLTGGTGVFLYDVAALASKQIDEFNGEEPDRFTKDIPVWRRVRGDIDGDVDQGLFYESRRKIQEARGIQKRMEDSGEDVELTGEKAALASMDKGASKTTRALSKIRKQMAEVKRDPEISATERAVRIRELRAERDALVNEFNRDFMDTMRDYFEAPSGDQ